MDSARTIKKLGAQNVKVIYRRTEKEMPAELAEIEAAKKDGVEFLFQTNILKAYYEKNSKKIECIKTQLIQKENETRKVPVNIVDSNFILDIDYLVMAVGSKPNKKIINMLNLETDNWGYLKINENYQTSNEKIYAIGDLAGNKQTVAWATKSGFECAKAIIQNL